MRSPFGRLRIIAAIVVAGMGLAIAQFASAASERTLSFHNLHTGETVTALYKRDGRYIPEGLAQINHALRDWRQNQATEMDPRLLDLVWEIYQQTGSSAPINIISAYRSPTTNEMLRSSSNGVAQNSQHVLGKAMDIQFPDVDLQTLRNVALRMQIGGVGYYPTSGSPFVHVDTGSVRHWPRLSDQQLAAVFPEGHSLHIPSSGTPLPGYSEAQAAYQARGQEVVALYGQPSPDDDTRRLAGLFDRNDDPAPAAQPTPVAAPAPVQPEPIAVAGVTVLPAPPTPRAAVMAGETQPTVALAFAPATETETDPLAILTRPVAPALDAAVPAAPPQVAAVSVQRRWNDPLAVLHAPIISNDTLTVITRPGTLRQANALRLSMPYVGAAPEFLIKPERVVAGGFDGNGVMPNTTRFRGQLAQSVAMVNLLQLTVADAR